MLIFVTRWLRRRECIPWIAHDGVQYYWQLRLSGGPVIAMGLAGSRAEAEEKLQDAIERLRLSTQGFEETSGGDYTRVQHVLSLPPDPESQLGAPSLTGSSVPPPRAIEPAPQSTTSLPASP